MTAWRLIVGPPGTGKTTALLRVLREELDRGVPPDRIAFWSFTRAARLEALGRVHAELGLSEDDMPWLRTVHSTAYRLLHVRPERLMLDERWQEFGKKHGYTLSSIYAEELAEPPRRTDADTMRYVLGWGRCRRYDVATTHNRSRIAVHGALFRLFWERYEEFKRGHDLLDFSDIVEDVIARERRPDIDVALIDEAQDLSPLEIAAIEIWSRAASRVYVAGDPDQCHPPGVEVQVDRKPVPIELLRTGDRIDAWMRSAQEVYRGRRVTVSSRPYSGKLIEIHAAGRQVPMTPNHRLVARWTPTAKKALVTYLMWRQDLGFRVGWCKLFSEGQYSYFHFGQRTRMERADAAWILRVFESRTEASAYESIVAAHYGLPTATFEPVPGATHLTRPTITKIFEALKPDNRTRGLACLADHGRDISMPLYPWPDAKTAHHRKSTVFQVFAANALADLMAVPLPQGRNQWAPISRVTSRNYDGLVHSLDVERDHSYVANGLVVLNSIYNFKGATPDWMLGLADRAVQTTYLEESHRVPQSAHEMSQTIISWNRNRLPSHYAPAPREGLVERRVELATALASIDDTKGAFVLSRNRYFLRRATRELFERARPYVVEGGRAGPNPLGSARILCAVRTALSIHRGASRIASPDVAALLSYAPANSGLVFPGAHRAVQALHGFLDVGTAAVDHGFVPLVEALRAHPTDPLVGLSRQYRRYFQDLIDRYGEIPAATIRLMTMHASKGREHDHVVILTDHTKLVDVDCRHGDIEGENRIRYVAVTRTRSRLTITRPSSKKFFQYPSERRSA